MENILINWFTGLVAISMVFGIILMVRQRYLDNVELDAIQEQTANYSKYKPPMDEVYNISTVGDQPNHTEFDEETQTFTMSRRDDV